MSITFPIVAPSSPAPSSVVLTFANAVAVGISPYNFKTQVTDYGGAGWGLEVSFDPLYRNEAAPWIAFLASLRGQFGTFLMGVPAMGTPLGVGALSNTARVNGAGQNGYELNSDGWPINSTILKAGDLFEIDNRLYIATKDADSNGSGVATIDCWPYLKGHADESVINTNNPVGVWRLTTNIIRGADIPNTELYSIAFTAQEAV